MIKWIFENKEWIFSGIGGLVLLLILKLLKPIWKINRIHKTLQIFKGNYAWSWTKTVHLAEIFYPERFENTPNLTVHFPKKERGDVIGMRDGMWRNYGNNPPKPHYTILEQRPEGFLIQINTIEYYKRYFCWIAKGTIKDSVVD